MSKEQYEWVVAIALSLHKPQNLTDPDRKAVMSVITAMAGQLAPNDWVPANDPDEKGAKAALFALMLALSCAKWIVFLTVESPGRAISRVGEDSSAIPRSPSKSHVFPVAVPNLMLCHYPCTFT